MKHACAHCKHGEVKKLKQKVKEYAKHEAKEMKEAHHLKKELHHAKKAEHHKKKHHESSRFKNKVAKVMHEFKEGALHSGSKKGPVVTNPKQAIAISLSEARRRKK